MSLAAQRAAAAPGLQPAASETSRLVVPVLLLLILSTVMIGVLTLLAARSLDEHAAQSQRRIAEALVEHNLRHLAKQAYDYAWWDDMAAHAHPGADPAWADENVGGYIHKAYGYNSSWVLGPDDATYYAFIERKPTDRALLDAGGAPIRELLERTRASSDSEPDPASGLVRFDGEIHFVGVCAITPTRAADAGSAPKRSVLVFTKRLDGAFLSEAESTYGLHGLQVVDALPSGAWDAADLRDPSGAVIGLLVWRPETPGSNLLGQVWPAIAVALAAMLLLAALFVHRANQSGERQVQLALALERERELRELKSRFVNMVSHEIRTPLTVIRSASDMLLRYGEKLTPDERGREISAIQREVAQLAGMVEDMLTIGRAEQTDRPLKPDLIDLEETVRERWTQAERATGRRMPVTVSVAPDARLAWLDPELLRAILLNLFVNAIKFTPSGLPADVRIRRENGEIAIAVGDRGVGVPENELEAVFEPFHRAANVGAASGSGLGLAIVRQAATRHGGRVEMLPRQPDGVEVRVRLHEAVPRE